MGGFKDSHLSESKVQGVLKRDVFVLCPFLFESFLMDPSFDKYKKEQSSPTLCVVIV